MLKDKNFLLYFGLFYIFFFLGIFLFYLFNPFENKCVSGTCDNGYGIYVFNSGMKYSGEWKNGKRHGEGIITYPNGSYYTGKWKDNRMHGEGVKTYIDKNIYKYSGEWKNGHKHGKGTQIYTSGSQFVGEWENGKVNGYGMLTKTNGTKIEGKWKDLVALGLMKEIFPDGSILMVEWQNQRRHGLGIMTYPDGTKIRQEWINNKLVGSSDYYLFNYYEFSEGYSIAALCSAINEDINLSLTADNNTIKWLNELLRTPNLYDQLKDKLKDKKLPMEVDELVKIAGNNRKNSFSELTNDGQINITKLNRLLLEHAFPEETPKIQLEVNF